MTMKACCLLVGTAAMGLLALLGWLLYPASPGAQAETPALVAANGSADIRIVSQWVEGPAEIPLSENVPINVRKVVHNVGPDGPVNAQTLKTATAPPGCTIAPTSHLQQIYNLRVSVDVTINEPFTVRCNNPSWHTFTFDNVLTVTTAGFQDPNPSNNTWHSEWTVAAVTSADLQLVSQKIIGWPSGEIFASVDVVVTLEAEVKNNGPYGPVVADVRGQLAPPTGCTATPNPAVTQVTLNAAETKKVQQQFTIHCLTGGLRTFSFYSRIDAKDPHIEDPNLANNEMFRFLPSFKVVDNTDVKIISQSLVNPPTQINVNENVDVTLSKLIHNNGPASPIDVSISSQGIAPTGCTVTPKSVPTSIPQVPVSVSQPVDEIWTIRCTQPSTHSFTFNNSISTILADLVPGNNSASTPLTVTVLAEADVGISGQELLAGDCTNAAPEEMVVSESTDVCLRKTLHNTGTFGPVDVSIAASASAPDDCSASADPNNPTSTSLPVSTDVVVEERWTIHCDAPSSHEFSFDNDIAVTTAHVNDPNQGNNSASANLIVAAIAQADVKINSHELVDPPTEIEVGQDVSITVLKHLHNNGTHGPVEVSISSSVVEPPGCTATLEDNFGGGSYSGAASSEGRAFNASSDGLVVGFDMDPTGNSCPNNASGPDCTLGIIETCVEVSEGDVFEFDVFMDGLPMGDDILGFGYDINAFPGTLAIPQTHKNGAINLPAQPGSMLLDISETVPDSSPPHKANVADLIFAEPNPPFTKGVLGRYKLDVTGVGSGVYGMTLSDILLGNFGANDLCTLYGCTIWDADFTTPYGLIAVDDECPTGPPPPSPTPVTYTLTMAVSPAGAGTTVPPEGDHTYDEDTVVEIEAIAGPGYAFDSWSGDPDCSDGSVTMDANKSCTANFVPAETPTPPPTVQPGIVELPVSVDTEVEETWIIRCTEPSTHTFSFGNAIAINDVHVSDPIPDNNSASSDLTVDAIAQADVKVVGVQVNGPTEIDVSTDVDITVSTTLHNNGTWGPVGVGLSYTPTAPPDCDVETVDPPQVSLPTSVDVVDNHIWTIHCSQPSSHTFSFQTDITGIKDPHVVDPNENNNSGSADYTVTAWSYADLKLADQYFEDPPSEIPVSQNVQVTLKKVLHNNGDYAPVDAITETTVVVPPDCTVKPTTHVQEFYNIPVSADVTHEEPFTIHCSDVSSHEFVFNAELTMIAGTHVRDPNLANDTISTPLVVAAVAPSDVKIESVSFVNPPIKIPINQWTDITLRKVIHNNGPWQPVDIHIDATAIISEQSGCEIVPESVPDSLDDVPTSLDQTVDEVWSVRCLQPGLKTFFFDNSINVTNAHVYDPDPDNNTSHKLLSVRDDTYPYWGDDICDGVDNDGDTVADKDWDLNGNTIADCLDPELDNDCDDLTNDADEDDDGDGWTDADEGFMRTDPLNACPIDETHDAWPPDVHGDQGCGYHNGQINILDILCYKPFLQGPYDRRYDLNTDDAINILDVLLYKWVIGNPCPDPCAG